MKGGLRCSPKAPCEFHRDGGDAAAKCPSMCHSEGCTLDGHYEVGTELTMCCVHAAIVLLTRAVYEAVAVDNDRERGA